MFTFLLRHVFHSITTISNEMNKFRLGKLLMCYKAWMHVCAWMQRRSKDLIIKAYIKKKSTKCLVMPTFIVSLLLNLSSSQVSLLPPSVYYQVIRYQSSTVEHQSTDSVRGGLSVSSCLLHPALWQPLRGSWDTTWRGDLALTLHREILSFGALLLRYQLMPRKCPDKTLDAFYPILRRREKSSSHVFCALVKNGENSFRTYEKMKEKALE